MSPGIFNPAKLRDAFFQRRAVLQRRQQHELPALQSLVINRFLDIDARRDKLSSCFKPRALSRFCAAMSLFHRVAGLVAQTALFLILIKNSSTSFPSFSNVMCGCNCNRIPLGPCPANRQLQRRFRFVVESLDVRPFQSRHVQRELLIRRSPARFPPRNFTNPGRDSAT